MMTIKSLEQYIRAYFATHPSNPKVIFEFDEQRPNLSTTDEHFPVVAFCFSSAESIVNVRNFNFNVFALDRLQDDRSNVVDVMSEMELILNDIYLHHQNNSDLIDVTNLPSYEPINNFDLDYVAGWSGFFTFEVGQVCINLTTFGD